MRNSAIDFIKGIAILTVIALHTNYLGEISLAGTFIFNTFMRFAVPFFFVVTGYFLFNKLKKSQNKDKVLKTYIKRSLLLYVSSLTLCMLVDYFVIYPLWQVDFYIGNVTDIISGITAFAYYGVETFSSFHLWFLVAMFWAAVIISIVCRKNLNNIKAVLFVSFIIHIIGLFGLTQPLNLYINLPLNPRDGIFFALFYMALGAYFALYGLNTEKFVKNKNLAFTVILCFVLLFVERYILVLPNFNYETLDRLTYQSNWGEYFITLIPLIIFIFKYALVNGDKFKENFITKVGNKSIGVYVVHLIVLNLISSLIYSIRFGEVIDGIIHIVMPMIILVISYYIYVLYLHLKNKVLNRKKDLVKKSA